MIEIKITGQNEKRKLKKLCFRYFDKAPQSFTYKMLRKKNILLNDKKATGEEILCAGDTVKIYVSDDTISKLHSSGGAPVRSDNAVIPIKEMIIEETKDYLILNKPAGILSQKAEASDYSINEAIIDFLLRKGSVSAESLETFRPSICNRLDRNTSGIITAGITLTGLKYLSEKISGRDVIKTYLAIVHGRFDKNGIIELRYKKDREKNIVTVSEIDSKLSQDIIKTGFRFIRYNSQFDISLVEAVLYTGKSHQIRASLKYLGFPICGDIKYGDKDRDRNLKPRPKRQLLHSYKLMISETETFTAELPEDMSRYFDLT